MKSVMRIQCYVRYSVKLSCKQFQRVGFGSGIRERACGVDGITRPSSRARERERSRDDGHWLDIAHNTNRQQEQNRA